MSIVYTKHTFEDKTVRYAIVDQANIANKHPEMFKKVRDITLSLTTRIAELSRTSDVKVYNNIDDAMADSIDVDLMLIQSVGNFIKSNEILKHLEEYYTANPEFFMLAFTLDWEAEHNKFWIECHHQMIFINVDTWKKIGSPKFGDWEQKIEALPNYSRSAENFHDKYTPYWMRGEPGTTIKYRTKQGWGFIKAAFQHGIKIDNFTEDMRNTRLYIYPETETSELFEAFTTGNTKLVSNPNQKKWIKSLTPPPSIWVYNSERYYFLTKNKKCTTYFGPAAGFKYLDILSENDNVKFIFYDFHQKSIDWIKELKETWDGNNFPGYLDSKSEEFSKYYKFVNSNISNNQDLLLQDFGGEENFKRLWNKFKNSEAEFIKCDLFDIEQVKNLISHTTGTIPFFYYSNIFATDSTLSNFTLDEVTKYHNHVLDMIFNTYPEAIIHGCNSFGTWIDYNREEFKNAE